MPTLFQKSSGLQPYSSKHSSSLVDSIKIRALPHANVVVAELETAASTDRLQKVVRLGGVDKEALKLAGEILARSFAIAL